VRGRFAVRFELSEPEATKDLVRYLRVTGYLAVDRGNGIVEAVPIRAVSRDADRRRTVRDVEAWATGRGDGVEARRLENDDDER
jgi:hypothetical protein